MITTFDNKSDHWKEWRTHFQIAVMDSYLVTAEVLELAELSEGVIFPEHVTSVDPTYQQALDIEHALHARLVAFTTGVLCTMVESANGEGIEAWRLLSRKNNPRIQSRCVQLLLSIINFKVFKMESVLLGLVRCEAQVAILARDHTETLSEKMRIALMIMTLPTILQHRASEHLDRLATFQDVHDKIRQPCAIFQSLWTQRCDGLQWSW